MEDQSPPVSKARGYQSERAGGSWALQSGVEEVGESGPLSWLPFAFKPLGFPRVSGLWVGTSSGGRGSVAEGSPPVSSLAILEFWWGQVVGEVGRKKCEDILLGT